MLVSAVYEELKKAPYHESKIPLYRLFCDGFRSGGYMDVIYQKLLDFQEKYQELEKNKSLYVTKRIIEKILTLRVEALPTNYHISRRFFHYARLFDDLLYNLKETSKIDREIALLYDIFIQNMEKITQYDGLYLLNWEDPFLLEHGTIDLPDQGIKIIQGFFASNFSMNYALVSPGCIFYHNHEYLWEYHFIDEYLEECSYEHFRAGKKFRIQDRDIISMAPKIAHGGFNPENSVPFKLGFVAGSIIHGPWRFDFNDRGAPSRQNLISTRRLEDLNGVHLDPIINELVLCSKENQIKSIKFLVSECEANLKVIKVSDFFNFQPFNGDRIIKVLKGEGLLKINDSIEQTIKQQDSFLIPQGIQCSIDSNEILMLVFESNK